MSRAEPPVIEQMDPGLHVLIVDDNPLNLTFMRMQLKSLGHHIHQAPDGAEALKVLESERIEVVLSDILMPNMDGYRLCLEMKHNPRFRGVPIVLHSSAPYDPPHHSLVLKIGATFLERPATMQQIDDALRGAVAHPPATLPSVATQALGMLGTLRMYNERLVNMIEEKNIELVRQAIDARASEEKFRQLAESIREAFWVSNPDSSEIHYISPAYEQIWGRPCKELYEHPQAWLESVHPEDRERVAAIATVEIRKDLDFEYRIVRSDGSVRSIHARAFPVRDAAGNIIRIAGVAEDVTDHKALENQLRHAQKMEAVGRLAGGIAHDFNNLLTAINGYSELTLEKLEQGNPLRPVLEQIRKSGERAAGLTGQLLAFSRKQVIQPRVLNANVVVAGVERMLRRLIGEDVQLVTKLRADIGNIRVDPGQLEQVLVNLAVNARDAMPRGGKLLIETDGAAAEDTVGAKPGNYVRLVVEDTGTGMSDDVKAHLFEPFFTTKEVGKGTGLGLATVYGIVQQSGGHLEVTSELGYGSRFTIYLPTVADGADHVEEASSTGVDWKGSGTVLVAEDDSDVRSFVRLVLERAGFKVIESRRGDEALLMASRHEGPIDLLVTDMVMPGFGGPDLARRLTERNPRLRVLFMSGYTDTDTLGRSEVPLAAELLPKPFTPEKLIAALRRVLDARTQSAG